MLKKSVFSILVLLIMASMVLSACATGAPAVEDPAPAVDSNIEDSADVEASQDDAPAEEPPTGDALKVALGTYGPVTDGGWSALHYEGLLQTEEMGAEIALSDGVDVPEMEAVLRDYCSQGYDLVFGQSFAWGDPALKVAADFPDCHMVITTGIVEAANVSSFWPNEIENHYLSGALAAKMTESGIVGLIGGVDLPNMRAKMNAFVEGAHATDPEVTVLTAFVGSWTDMALGKELALGFVEQGADVIDHLASTAGLGAIEAAAEKDVYMINDIVLNQELAPDNMIGAQVAHFDRMVVYFYQSLVDDTWVGSKWRPGLAEGMIDLELSDLVPQDVADEIDVLRQKIIDGEIVLEENFELP